MKTSNLVKKVISYVEKEPTLCISLISASSIIVTAIFKMATYIYYRGYFEQLNIPVSYIKIDYQDMLYLFCLNIAILFITFVISNIYVMNYFSIGKHNKKAIRILKQIGMLLLIVFGVFVYFIVQLLVDFSPQEILMNIRETWVSMTIYVTCVSFLIGFIVFTCGTPGYELCKESILEEETTKESRAEEKNTKKKNSNRVLLWLLENKFCLLATLIGIVLVLGSWAIYTSGQDRVKYANSVSIVEINNLTYFVAMENTEECILKECVQVGDEIRINRNHYIRTTLVDRDVIVKRIDGGLDKCLLDDNDYKSLLGTK